MSQPSSSAPPPPISTIASSILPDLGGIVAKALDDKNQKGNTVQADVPIIYNISGPIQLIIRQLPPVAPSQSENTDTSDYAEEGAKNDGSIGIKMTENPPKNPVNSDNSPISPPLPVIPNDTDDQRPRVENKEGSGTIGVSGNPKLDDKVLPKSDDKKESTASEAHQKKKQNAQKKRKSVKKRENVEHSDEEADFSGDEEEEKLDVVVDVKDDIVENVEKKNKNSEGQIQIVGTGRSNGTENHLNSPETLNTSIISPPAPPTTTQNDPRGEDPKGTGTIGESGDPMSANKLNALNLSEIQSKDVNSKETRSPKESENSNATNKSLPKVTRRNQNKKNTDARKNTRNADDTDVSSGVEWSINDFFNYVPEKANNENEENLLEEIDVDSDGDTSQKSEKSAHFVNSDDDGNEANQTIEGVPRRSSRPIIVPTRYGDSESNDTSPKSTNPTEQSSKKSSTALNSGGNGSKIGSKRTATESDISPTPEVPKKLRQNLPVLQQPATPRIAKSIQMRNKQPILRVLPSPAPENNSMFYEFMIINVGYCRSKSDDVFYWLKNTAKINQFTPRNMSTHEMDLDIGDERFFQKFSVSVEDVQKVRDLINPTDWIKNFAARSIKARRAFLWNVVEPKMMFLRLLLATSAYSKKEAPNDQFNTRMTSHQHYLNAMRDEKVRKESRDVLSTYGKMQFDIWASTHGFRVQPQRRDEIRAFKKSYKGNSN